MTLYRVQWLTRGHRLPLDAWCDSAEEADRMVAKLTRAGNEAVAYPIDVPTGD